MLIRSTVLCQHELLFLKDTEALICALNRVYDKVWDRRRAHDDMSNSFIGLTMLVTLSSPPGAQLRGVVSGIEPGKSLTLKNGSYSTPHLSTKHNHKICESSTDIQSFVLVTCPANGKFVPEFMIDANEIVKLVEASDENTVPVQRSIVRAKQAPVSRNGSAFEDPAILSMGKRPASQSRASVPQQWSAGENDMQRVDSARTATTNEMPVYQDPVALAAAKMVEDMQKIGMQTEDVRVASGRPMVDEPEELGPELVAVKGDGTAKIRGGRRPRNREGRKVPAAVLETMDSSPVKTPKRGKGWRQTPLLTELTENFQPFNSLNKKNGRRNKTEDSGWGTEDATDVQDMGDFDFESSLAKFDKRTVFNEIQAEDSVLDEDRLVAHNRLPKSKPGTAGGKNLHYTENVLETKKSLVKGDAWKSEAGDSEEEDRDGRAGSGSGRLSRRAHSKLATNRRPTSRKGSATMNNGQQRTSSVGILDSLRRLLC